MERLPAGGSSQARQSSFRVLWPRRARGQHRVSTSRPSDCCALFCSVSFYLHGERPGRVLGAVGLASVSSSSTVVVCAPCDTCSITALRSNLLVALGKWADVALYVSATCRVVSCRVGFSPWLPYGGAESLWKPTIWGKKARDASRRQAPQTNQQKFAML